MAENKHPNEQDQNQPNSGDAFADDVLKNINVNEEADANDSHQGVSNEQAHEEKEGTDLLSRMGFKSGGKDTKHKKEIEELKQQLGEQKDQYLRLYAEFDNFKKRTAKERIEWFKTASQDVIQSLLPVLDDFERAEKNLATSKDIEAVKEGIRLVQHKLKTTLEQRGLVAMESIGKDFNVEEHEAVTEIPAPTEEMKGKVIDEVERGYKLSDKIIRYAKVIVGK
ncbi:MAG TPA: nucleotide exchange factor GrpE [Chitinophagales bacterium]|nr:nucleotide exchange factor GrpE [Chitinophagales bacterium]